MHRIFADFRRENAIKIAIGTGLIVLMLVFGCACTENGASDEDYDWILDPCGFGEPTTAEIDVSIRSDVYHGNIFSRIEASLRNGPVPSFHEVVMEEGDCKYYKAVPGICDPACGGGEICTVDGECVAYPEGISGGTLKITGLDETVKIQPEDWSEGTYIGPGGLPGQLFGPGDSIGASLAGGAFPALAVGATGVMVMDTDHTDNGFEMVDGQDAVVTWTPGEDPDACVRVVINGFNVVHGAPLSDIVVCEGTDTGNIVIPQGFVEEFPHGTAPEVTEGYDWPHSELTRYTRNTVDTEMGRVEFTVRSTTYFLPSHPE